MDEAPQVIRTVLDRRSTRVFLPTPIAETALALIVRCGLSAPSSKNARPWRFHVVRDRDQLASLGDAVEHAPGADTYVPHDPSTGAPRPEYQSTVRESAEVLRTCAAAIFVENRCVFSRGRGTLSTIPPDALASSLFAFGLEHIGLGAAVENMLLAASSLGLGAAFMGDVVVSEGAVAEALGVSGDLVGVVALGHPGERMPSRASSIDSNDPELVVWH